MGVLTKIAVEETIVDKELIGIVRKTYVNKKIAFI